MKYSQDDDDIPSFVVFGSVFAWVLLVFVCFVSTQIVMSDVFNTILLLSPGSCVLYIDQLVRESKFQFLLQYKLDFQYPFTREQDTITIVNTRQTKNTPHKSSHGNLRSVCIMLYKIESHPRPLSSNYWLTIQTGACEVIT